MRKAAQYTADGVAAVTPKLQEGLERLAPRISDAVDDATPHIHDALEKAAPAITSAKDKVVDDFFPLVSGSWAMLPMRLRLPLKSPRFPISWRLLRPS
ncbi:hypothetical protein NHF46_22050 [Arthrobacter alpinus]|nr:hypothetical protein [Arthrobacter alpinus]